MATLRGKRIFIIEDDLANRAIAQIALEQAGARTAIDRWGKEAVAKIHKFLPVDLILLDLMLPDNVSGFEVFDLICQEEALQNIPIVAFSAAEAGQAIEQARSKGFAGFIAKPIDIDLFAQQVAQILSGQTLWLAQNLSCWRC